MNEEKHMNEEELRNENESLKQRVAEVSALADLLRTLVMVPLDPALTKEMMADRVRATLSIHGIKSEDVEHAMVTLLGIERTAVTRALAAVDAQTGVTPRCDCCFCSSVTAATALSRNDPGLRERAYDLPLTKIAENRETDEDRERAVAFGSALDSILAQTLRSSLGGSPVGAALDDLVTTLREAGIQVDIIHL